MANKTNSAKNLLEINNLTVTYGEFKIITEVSFAVKPGEIVCIAGESGCGKSTLIKAVLGIKQLGAQVTEGSIILDGRDITHLGVEERRQILGTQIGYVPQNTRGSFNNIRSYDVQYLETMRSHGLKFDRQEAIKVFKRLNFPDPDMLLAHQPWEMSGGMNQRMAIGLAVLQDPKLMLCDEATSVLDVTSQKEVIEELAKLRDELGWSILFITHNLGVASHIADKLGVMYAGRMVEYGNTRSSVTIRSTPTRGVCWRRSRARTASCRRVWKAARRWTVRNGRAATSCPDVSSAPRLARPSPTA